MAKCDICSKEISFGIKVSHSHRRSNRTWKPNGKKVMGLVEGTTGCMNSLPAFRQSYQSYLINLYFLKNTEILIGFRVFFYYGYF